MHVAAGQTGELQCHSGLSTNNFLESYSSAAIMHVNIPLKMNFVSALLKAVHLRRKCICSAELKKNFTQIHRYVNKSPVLEGNRSCPKNCYESP